MSSGLYNCFSGRLTTHPSTMGLEIRIVAAGWWWGDLESTETPQIPHQFSFAYGEEKIVRKGNGND